MFQKSVINSIKRDENFITFKLIKKEIDSMVYKFYDLTSEVIKIVESIR